jgi:pimeloyl-ACP methyl ester carboxylesterase
VKAASPLRELGSELGTINKLISAIKALPIVLGWGASFADFTAALTIAFTAINTVPTLFFRLGNAHYRMHRTCFALYDRWHEYFRNRQPRMLILWGKNDPFFTVQGAKAYQRDLPNAELHLIDTGHFALEDSSDFIAFCP